MNPVESTIDKLEVEKFAQHAKHWWDKEGPLKTLHDINPIRLDFIRAFSPLSGLKVLDIGCGGGILCEALAKAGAQVTGIDVEKDAIEAAKAHAQQSQLTIDYFCEPIETFEHSGFDVVTCMELLEHVHSPDLILQHATRLSKPQGLLFLSTISRTIKAYARAILAAEYVLNIVPKQTHDYQKFIKPSELVALCRSLDWNLLDMQGMGYNPFSRKAFLQEDVSVNYLLALQRLGE